MPGSHAPFRELSGLRLVDSRGRARMRQQPKHFTGVLVLPDFSVSKTRAPEYAHNHNACAWTPPVRPRNLTLLRLTARVS